jgi:hypothetical protein
MELNNRILFDLADAVFYSDDRVSKVLLEDIKFNTDNFLEISNKDESVINKSLKKNDFFLDREGLDEYIKNTVFSVRAFSGKVTMFYHINYSVLKHNCSYLLQGKRAFLNFEGALGVLNRNANMKDIGSMSFTQSEYFLFDGALLSYSNALITCENLTNISRNSDIRVVVRLPSEAVIETSQNIINNFLACTDIVVGSIAEFNALLGSATDSETISKISREGSKINYAVIINSTGAVILNKGLLHIIPILSDYEKLALSQKKSLIDAFIMLFLYGLVKNLLWRNAAQLAGLFVPVVLSGSCVQLNVIDKINEFLKKQSK